jgi:hemerythrin
MIKTSEIIWQDTQHQILFKLIDAIKDEPFDREILVKLQLYAEHHFSLEEAYMVELKYPQIDAHVEVHNRFRDELTSMVEMPLEMNATLQASLSTFLSEWLKLHVFGIDK